MAGAGRYGNLVDFSPGPVEGSYRFTDTAGKERIFAGPDAEKAAQALGKLKAQEQSQLTAAAPAPAGDTRTDVPTPVPGAAGAGGSSGLGIDPVGTPGGFGGQVPSDFSQPAPAAPAAAPAPSQGPPPSIAREGAAAPAAGGAAGATPRLSDGKGGFFVQEEGGGWMHWTPPRSGSKGGLLEKTRTVQGGYEADPEFEQRKAARTVAEIGVGQQQAADQLALSQRLQEQAAAEAKAQQQAAEQQRLEMDFGNRRVAEAEALHQRALQDYQSSDTKPEFTTTEAIIGALVAGFGTFGSGMAGTENFGLSLVRATVDERIRQEESELALKKETADNALSKLVKETGSVDLAKRSLEGILLKQSENKWRSIAALEGDIKLRAEAEKQALSLAGAYDDWLNAYRQAAGGEVTRSLQYIAPTAGSRGGFQLPTIDEAKSLTGLAGAEAANTGAALGNVKNARELERQGAGVPTDPKAKELLGDLKTVGAMKKALVRNASAGGAPWSPEAQNFLASGVRTVQDGLGGGNAYKNTWLDEEEKRRADEFNTAKNFLVSLGTQMSGAGAPSEGESIRSAAASATEERQLLNVVGLVERLQGAKLGAYGVNVPQAPGLRAEE